ncbi:MAG TPA: class I SAM-dependent methyltransferase [Phycisphaerae bacterium]|nr:class I SAM-dependent methyltransferase [Phycisphaerae bacterium]
MARLSKKQDAYGQAIWDCYHQRGGYEINERDDGFVGVSMGPPAYLAEFEDWPARQKQAIRLARGKVLDVGCGAGRVALYLQSKGLEATGIDVSPRAVEVCRLRGLKKAEVLSITQLGPKFGVFDTIVMYGNNFGLFGSFRRARWLLRRFRNLTTPAGRIIAETNDPYGTGGPARPSRRCHLEYHKRNRKRGRMGGQVRIRARYLTYATPWFDYLMVSKDEMRRIVAGTGWKITRFFDSKGSGYVAVLEKEHSP